MHAFPLFFFLFVFVFFGSLLFFFFFNFVFLPRFLCPFPYAFGAAIPHVFFFQVVAFRESLLELPLV